MRAKTINEIQKFERGKDAKSAAGIGKAKEAYEYLENLFNSRAQKYGARRMYDIKVNSLDNIEITYSKDLINATANSKDPEDLTKYKWIIKYHPIKPFEVEDYYHEGTFMNHVTRDNDWQINRVRQNHSNSPDQLGTHKTYVCSVAKKIDDSQKIAQTMVDGLNSNYGDIWVYECISPKSSQ